MVDYDQAVLRLLLDLLQLVAERHLPPVLFDAPVAVATQAAKIACPCSSATFTKSGGIYFFLCI